jgi:1-acyl-sn-glycerol-3-phosphate acyltransferase
MKRDTRASWWRAKLWGLILSTTTDGVSTVSSTGAVTPLTRRPPVPEGPLIILASHPSRVDAFAIAATIGRTRAVRFVASADYWLDSTVYLWAARIFAGVWLTRRAARSELLAAAATVDAGVALVSFAQPGTNRHDPDVFELAAATGARILPVAIVGTEKVLPAGGRRMMRHPIEIRWGTPFTVDRAEDATDAAAWTNVQITRLAAAPAEPRAGAGWTRIRRVAFGWTGLGIVAFWAFFEGMFWPLLAEMPLLLLVVTVGRSWRGPLLIAVSALASACGILATWFLVSHGINTPEPLTTARMHAVALAQLTSDPSTAFWNQMWNGIPVKVYAHATGDLGMSFFQVVSVMFPRLLRIGIIGGAGWLLGGVLSRFLKPCLGAVQVFCLALFPFGLALVIFWWS